MISNSTIRCGLRRLAHEAAEGQNQHFEREHERSNLQADVQGRQRGRGQTHHEGFGQVAGGRTQPGTCGLKDPPHVFRSRRCRPAALRFAREKAAALRCLLDRRRCRLPGNRAQRRASHRARSATVGRRRGPPIIIAIKAGGDQAGAQDINAKTAHARIVAAKTEIARFFA